MHFWIDKRSQCGYNGRRVPPSLSTGVGRTRRERHLKPMVTPVHRFQSVECVAGPARPHHPSHQGQRQHNHYGNPYRNSLSTNGIHLHSPRITAQDTGESTTVFLEPPPTRNSETSVGVEAGGGSAGGGNNSSSNSGARQGAPLQHSPPLMAAHVKCGLWASFALASIFVASAKFYADHQMLYSDGSGMEAFVLSGLLVVLLLAVCIVTLCRAKLPPPLPLPMSLPPPQPLPMRQDSNSDLSLGTMLSLQAALPQRQLQGLPPVPPPPPPPYHIAVLLPARPVTEQPPPSYEKAVS